MGRLGGWVKKKVKNVEKREEIKEVETQSEKKATESKKKKKKLKWLQKQQVPVGYEAASHSVVM